MKFLTIDTTTKINALALAEDGNLIGESFLHTTKTHSERLIPMLNQLLTAASWQLTDLDFIGVVRGPGSFTGIRIGIATAQGLVQVLQIPMIGVLSLEVLAWAGYGCCSNDIVPILDARKNEWYTAHYRWLNGAKTPECLSPPQAVAPEKWLQEIAGLNRSVLFAGDAAGKNRQTIYNILGSQGIVLPDYAALPRGAYAVQAVWQKWQSIPAEEQVEPFYIRLSEAEVTMAKKEEAQRRGRNG